MTCKKVVQFLRLAPIREVIFSRHISKHAVNFSPITNVELNSVDQNVQVSFSDNQTHRFPWLFLQDNCTCSSCFHSSSQSRARKMTDLNILNKIEKVEFNPKRVKCIWGDGHVGEFEESWLKSRRFSEDNTLNRKTTLRDKPELVDSNHEISRDRFDRILTDNKALHTFLRTLSKVGVYLLENAPKTTGCLKKVADRIGFIRLTHYGYEFTVKSEQNAVNLAYTSTKLGVHTDLPYYAYPPGVQMLHCIKQYLGEDGGQSHLVDGFLVAEQMRLHHHKQFETLCQVPVEFYDVGNDYTEFHKVHHSPTFVLHPETKRVTRIVYSNQQLSSYQPVPLENVRPLYEAMKTFTDLCYKPENLMVFKLKEGEILVFDNWRFLHGREGFNPTADSRHLEGCYVDWDEIFSRMRVIEDSTRLM